MFYNVKILVNNNTVYEVKSNVVRLSPANNIHSCYMANNLFFTVAIIVKTFIANR